jgi:tetrapyrrole methylase family protein/MazG family protein
VSEAFDRLYSLVKYLRSEKGCPWDREQTLDSLRPHLMEEMHELCEAIEEEATAKIREELGDVLFLLLFLGRIAEEEGRFTPGEVMEAAHAKMKSRHPHVFGTKQDLQAGDVLNQWEKAKQAQKPEGESVLSGIPRGLSGLTKAQRIQQRAASLGFDWEDIGSVFDKLKEEIAEFEEASESQDKNEIQEELGDMLFSIVNVARFLGIRAEDALQATNEKFKRRFAQVEREIARRGRMTLAEMDAIWEKSKGKEKPDRGVASPKATKDGLSPQE